MAYLERFLKIKKSTLPNAGKGLFTTIDIHKGTIICEYKGKIQKWEEVKHEDGHNGYLMLINRNTVINALNAKRTFGRYANDARGIVKVTGLRNNAEYSYLGKKCFIEASRNIKAGEEIFVYYGAEYWRLIRKIRKMTKVIS